MKTKIKDKSGSHLVDANTLFFKYTATKTDNFNAAAKPIISASKENMPTIKPLLKPLNMASSMSKTKAISIIILQKVIQILLINFLLFTQQLFNYPCNCFAICFAC